MLEACIDESAIQTGPVGVLVVTAQPPVGLQMVLVGVFEFEVSSSIPLEAHLPPVFDDLDAVEAELVRDAHP